MRNSGKNSTTIIFALAVIVLLLGTNTQSLITKTAEVRTRESMQVSHDSAQQVIVEYYEAINAGRYQEAYNFLSARYQAQLPYKQFVKMYRDYISGVEAVSSQLMPEFSTLTRKQFQVEFNAGYIKGYPTESGELPRFHRLVPHPNQPGEWLIEKVERDRL